MQMHPDNALSGRRKQEEVHMICVAYRYIYQDIEFSRCLKQIWHEGTALYQISLLPIAHQIHKVHSD